MLLLEGLTARLHRGQGLTTAAYRTTAVQPKRMPWQAAEWHVKWTATWRCGPSPRLPRTQDIHLSPKVVVDVVVAAL